MQVKGEILLVQAKVAGVEGFKETSHLVGSPINGVVQGTLSFPPGFDRLCGTSRAQLTPYFVPLVGTRCARLEGGVEGSRPLPYEISL